MANFPTSFDTYSAIGPSTYLSETPHSDRHQKIQDAIVALETKVGIDSSAITTSFDYKLSGVGTGDKAASLTGTENFTNKTFISPTISNKTSTGTDSGTEALNNKTIKSSNVSGTSSGTLVAGSGLILDSAAITASTVLMNNNVAIQSKDSSAASQNILKLNASNALEVGYAGQVGLLLQQKQKAIVYRGTSNQSIPATTYTKVQFNAEVIDPGNNFDSTTNYRYTIPAGFGGDYLITGRVELASTTRGISALYVNGTEVYRGADTNYGSANNAVITISTIVHCAASDYIELFVYSQSVTTLAFGQNLAYLAIHLLSV